jgi:hypothetical protein
MLGNKVVSLRQKDEIDDPLTDILRGGLRPSPHYAARAGGCSLTD